eukprot:tig00021072_g17973.t1
MCTCLQRCAVLGKASVERDRELQPTGRPTAAFPSLPVVSISSETSTSDESETLSRTSTCTPSEDAASLPSSAPASPRSIPKDSREAAQQAHTHGAGPASASAGGGTSDGPAAVGKLEGVGVPLDCTTDPARAGPAGAAEGAAAGSNDRDSIGVANAAVHAAVDVAAPLSALPADTPEEPVMAAPMAKNFWSRGPAATDGGAPAQRPETLEQALVQALGRVKTCSETLEILQGSGDASEASDIDPEGAPYFHFRQRHPDSNKPELAPAWAKANLANIDAGLWDETYAVLDLAPLRPYFEQLPESKRLTQIMIAYKGLLDKLLHPNRAAHIDGRDLTEEIRKALRISAGVLAHCGKAIPAVVKGWRPPAGSGAAKKDIPLSLWIPHHVLSVVSFE